MSVCVRVCVRVCVCVCVCVCIRTYSKDLRSCKCSKPGSQYDNSAMSVTSIVSITRKIYFYLGRILFVLPENFNNLIS